LRISYWKAFLVSIIVGIASGSGGGGGSSYNRHFGSSGSSSFSSSGNDLAFLGIAIGILIIIIIVTLLALAFRIFLGYALEVGGRKYFVQAAQNDISMDYLGYAFKKDRYLNVIKAMLWKALRNFLWYLALIIPGIIKSYAYRMVPYIMADNPNMKYDRALELSKQMTDGQKLDMFVLDLSFLGWILLGLVACCVGVIFVTPYINSTNAELYLVLRQNALTNGMCSYEVLGLQQPVQFDGNF
jgi:hypothetical protein